MAQNTEPVFALTAHLAVAELSAANTNRDGTGTIVDLFTPTSFGSRPRMIKAVAKAATTSGMINFFLHDGTSYKYWTAIPVTAITPSATTVAWEGYMDPAELELLDMQSTWKIGCAPTQAETFNVFAFGADLS